MLDQKSDNRTKLLQVGMTLFATHGYDGVGVQQIVEAVGVTKPTLYHYFESKHGLLKAIIDHHADDLLMQIRQAAKYDRNITSTIKTVMTAYFDYAVAHPVFYRMVLAMWFAPSSSEYYLDVADLQQRQFVMIEYLFQRAADDHGNMKGRHRQYAVTFKGMIDTYIGLSLQGYISLDNPQLVHQLAHQFMHGIFS
ncbi:MAG TPA: TetR/AcrR family transcriptional regulator [Phototrophicaceae bacterium]|jgi:TetR/AcrR family transcriptional regulator|nr:TetR/AcrR family transcriptional regulator [Phototrophicaceae bacterium]